jgi:hypothetical protein
MQFVELHQHPVPVTEQLVDGHPLIKAVARGLIAVQVIVSAINL